MGELTERVKRLILSLQISSASPGHINEVLQVDPAIDLDELVPDTESEDAVKKQIEIDTTLDKVKKFDRGNVGEIQRFTSTQFGNVRGIATNPVQFFIGSIFGRLAKGAGIAGLALLFFEIVKFIINELMKPGRFLDRRFREQIEDRILAFRTREEHAKLFEGTGANIIVTTIGGLRGGQGQVSSNLRSNAGLQPRIITQDIVLPTTTSIASGQDLALTRGQKRYRRQ